MCIVLSFRASLQVSDRFNNDPEGIMELWQIGEVLVVRYQDQEARIAATDIPDEYIVEGVILMGTHWSQR